LSYPRPEEEDEILRRRAERGQDLVTLQPVTAPEDFLAMRRAVEQVYIDPDLRRYMVDLADRTRSHRQVVVGASPRASLALLKLARAWAAIQGRAYILPDDVKEFAHAVLAHRIILDPSLWGNKKSELALVEEIIQKVPPVLQKMR
jgi:MoxR-like ATPase